MTEKESGLMRDVRVGTETGQEYDVEFSTTAYAEGLAVDYFVRMSFLRPTSGPFLFESDIQKIVHESLSSFLTELEKEMGK